MGQRTLAEAQISDAQQDRGPWYVRAGLLSTQADLKAAGQRAVGANADVKDNAAFPAKFRYQVKPNTR
jgi:outer membrane protein